MAVASLVLGIVSLLMCLVPGIGFGLAIIAIIISIVAISSKRFKEEQKGIKIAGLILSIIAFVISFLLTLLMFGAVILSINESERIIQDANQAVKESDLSALQGELSLQYVEMLMLNSDSDYLNDVDANYAQQTYLNILRTKYSELYFKGYRVQVNDNLSFKIIEP